MKIRGALTVLVRQFSMARRAALTILLEQLE
jgi:hypothetical protein